MATLNTSDLNRQGKVYTAANQAGATVTLINTSTATGFILSNPYGSQRKLSIIDLTFAYTTWPTAISVVWACLSIAPTNVAHNTTTALAVYNADGSGVATTNTARAYNASVTPNLPVYTRILGQVPTTPATAGMGVGFTDKIEGALVVVPGSYLQISYIGAAPVGQTSCTWAEFSVV
jgi:hypothetical protein